MSEPVLDPTYWANRLQDAERTHLHHSIFKCPLDRWQRIEEKHREILAKTILPHQSVLDVGCGYGRLLSLMSPDWLGYTSYAGIDISPELVAKAEELHAIPGCLFVIGDARKLPWTTRCLKYNVKCFDWAILISVRPMIKRNCGDEVWAEMETEIRKVAKKLLYLEYDPDDEGSVE